MVTLYIKGAAGYILVYIYTYTPQMQHSFCVTASSISPSVAKFDHRSRVPI